MSALEVSVDTANELKLVRDCLAFCFKWLGWRKWLRASGALERAFSTANYDAVVGDRSVRTDCGMYVTARGVANGGTDVDVIRRSAVKRWLRTVEQDWVRSNVSDVVTNGSIRWYVFSRDSKDVYPLLRSEIRAYGARKYGGEYEADERVLSDPGNTFSYFVGSLLRSVVLPRIDVRRYVPVPNVLSHDDFEADVLRDLSAVFVERASLATYEFDEWLRTFDDELLSIFLKILESCSLERLGRVNCYDDRSELCYDATSFVSSSRSEKIRVRRLEDLRWRLIALPVEFAMSSPLSPFAHLLVASKMIISPDRPERSGLVRAAKNDAVRLYRPCSQCVDGISVPPAAGAAIDRVFDDSPVLLLLDEKLYDERFRKFRLNESDVRAILNFDFYPLETRYLFGRDATRVLTSVTALQATFPNSSFVGESIGRHVFGDKTKSDKRGDRDASVCCTDRELVLRAMQVRNVALYRLAYDVSRSTTDTSSPLGPDETKYSNRPYCSISSEETKNMFLDAARRSRVSFGRYFEGNCLSRPSALTDAVLQQLPDLNPSFVRDTDSFRLSVVDTFEAMGDFLNDEKHSSRSDESAANSNNDADAGTSVRTNWLLAVTSVLFDSTAVERILVDLYGGGEVGGYLSRDFNEAWFSAIGHGVYVRRQDTPRVAYVLLPSDRAPEYDRSIKLPYDPSIDNSNVSSVVVPPSPNRYLRLCVLHSYEKLSDLKLYFFTTQGIAANARDVFNVMLPEKFRTFDFATLSAILGRVVRIDAYASKVVDPVLDDGSTRVLTTIRHLTDDTIVRSKTFSRTKLWRILRDGPYKAAFVRSSPRAYCPASLFDHVSVSNRGVVPLTFATDADTWKLYMYDGVASSSVTRTGPCDRTLYDDTVASFFSGVASSSTNERLYHELPSNARMVVSGRVRVVGVPLIATKDDSGRDWIVTAALNVQKFIGLTRSMGTFDSMSVSPVVRLIAPYHDHFVNDGTVVFEKLSSKRVYSINGWICFCEHPVKFVGDPPIRKYDVASRLNDGSFATSYDASCRRIISTGYSYGKVYDQPLPSLELLPLDHFYHRVFLPMVRGEVNPLVYRGGFVRLNFVETFDYIVLSFQCAVLWFPKRDLVARRIKHARDKTGRPFRQCYSDVSQDVANLVDHYVRLAAKRGIEQN